jgi:hypothetical protein
MSEPIDQNDPELKAALETLNKFANEGRIDAAMLFITFRHPEQPHTRGMRFDIGNCYASQGIVSEFVNELQANKTAVAIVQTQEAMRQRVQPISGALASHTRNGHPRG